ncbi:hypothetical protein ABIE27_003230 [Paenibacillus sp. 4624]|jgi:hypothetical protein|uniref:Uncharacterized protein n=1 Tax=Paenibacillus amylolyticus TaxID=1451 RepID=A0A5M9WNM6_PAEAM|nr:hypothetical protein [Paenibacillus amylolyticus]KAA8783171.1 hypothetical protein EC604_04840 [Paenibacillus amylolyticus]
MNNEQTKSLIDTISLEEYVQKGKLPQCLPADAQITLEQAKAQADEVWSVEKEKLEVFSFDYKGCTVNMTFQMDGTYLFDSIDVWGEVGNSGGVATEKELESNSDLDSGPGTSKLATLETVESIQQFAEKVGMKLEWFEMGDERVCLMPSAVTLHYLKQQKNSWKLVKIAGAYRSVGEVRSSLSSIADAMN